MSRVFSGLVAVRVTATYAVMLVVVATILWALGPQMQDRVVSQMSTNLHNLAHGDLGTLLGSAFLTTSGPIYAWLPGLVCLLALAELLWRRAYLLLAFGLGHIGATLIVAGGLAASIRFGWLPVSLTRASDVGVSYGAAAVLGALTAAVPPHGRLAWATGWLAVAVAVAASDKDFDFTATGHAVALMLGMVLSTRFRAPTPWTPVRCVLLVGAVAFGYVMLSGLSPPIAPFAGLAGISVALIAQSGVRRWRGRRSRTSMATTMTPAIAPA
ncbi:MAG: hypothetical protein JWR32_678 [Mycobacterium sp.]|nr:hypothetical protein [Mycobacterium sp.]